VRTESGQAFDGDALAELVREPKAAAAFAQKIDFIGRQLVLKSWPSIDDVQHGLIVVPFQRDVDGARRVADDVADQLAKHDLGRREVRILARFTPNP
jgi:hypothetical protein